LYFENGSFGGVLLAWYLSYSAFKIEVSPVLKIW